MKIEFNNNELKKIILNMLCNGGLNELHYCGVALHKDKAYRKNYENARRVLEKTGEYDTICFEDVLTQMIFMGKSLEWNDSNDGLIVGFTLHTFRRNLYESERGSSLALDTLEGRDDAITGLDLIQIGLYGRPLYG